MSVTDELVEVIWGEMSEILGHLDTDALAELQLFAYFPTLKLSALFGSTFVKEGLPINLLPLGPSILLLKDKLPPEKHFYIYLVIRERLDGGLKVSYAFPYLDWSGEMAVEAHELSITSSDSREEFLEMEGRIPSYAALWFEGD